jgi:hypothetical protein
MSYLLPIAAAIAIWFYDHEHFWIGLILCGIWYSIIGLQISLDWMFSRPKVDKSPIFDELGELRELLKRIESNTEETSTRIYSLTPEYRQWCRDLDHVPFSGSEPTAGNGEVES